MFSFDLLFGIFFNTLYCISSYFVYTRVFTLLLFLLLWFYVIAKSLRCPNIYLLYASFAIISVIRLPSSVTYHLVVTGAECRRRGGFWWWCYFTSAVCSVEYVCFHTGVTKVYGAVEAY